MLRIEKVQSGVEVSTTILLIKTEVFSFPIVETSRIKDLLICCGIGGLVREQHVVGVQRVGIGWYSLPQTSIALP